MFCLFFDAFVFINFFWKVLKSYQSSKNNPLLSSEVVLRWVKCPVFITCSVLQIKSYKSDSACIYIISNAYLRSSAVKLKYTKKSSSFLRISLLQ